MRFATLRSHGPRLQPGYYIALASSLGSRHACLRKSWSSQTLVEGVANCYLQTASLTINRGIPSTGRAEIAATAASYMQAFPDLQVSVDHVLVAGDSVFWVWTLTGTTGVRVVVAILSA